MRWISSFTRCTRRGARTICSFARLSGFPWFSGFPRPSWRKPRSARLGRRGERYAARFLASKGLRVIARNVRVGQYGEIDLIMLDGSCLVFVEVKTRSPSTWSDGHDKIDRDKRRVFRSAAAKYVRSLASCSGEWRIDVVLLVVEDRRFGRVLETTWIPHAF